MNRWFSAAVMAFSFGTTMPVVSQPMTREALFADYVQQNIALALNSVSGFKANVLGTKPELKSAPDDPVRGRPFGDTFAQMQADSSNGGEFTRDAPVFTAEAADPARNESFVDTFTRMQAASSSSGQFKLQAEPGRTRFAKTAASGAGSR